MDLKHFEALVAIADAGSITRAAELVYCTQPTLSTRIAALEEQLGTKLFIRSKQGVLLTDAGEKMYTYANNILKLAGSAISDLKADLDDPHGSVVVGCQDSLCNFVGARVIKGARENYPNIELEFLAENTPELYKQLGASRLDMGILQKDVSVLVGDDIRHRESLFESSTLEYFPLFDDEIVFCTQRSRSTPIFSDEPMPVAEIGATDIALPLPHHPITQSMEWIANECGVELKRIVYYTALDVVFDLIDDGLCSALLPKQLVARKGNDHNVMARRIGDYRISRSITLCCSPVLHLHTAPRLIKDFIIDILQDKQS